MIEIATGRDKAISKNCIKLTICDLSIVENDVGQRTRRNIFVVDVSRDGFGRRQGCRASGLCLLGKHREYRARVDAQDKASMS